MDDNIFFKVFEKAKGIILKPIPTFNSSRSDPISFAIIYFFMLLAVYVILFGFSVSFSLLASMMGGYVLVIRIALQLILTIFIGTLWLHIWVYVVGGRNGLFNTYKASIYAYTPFFLIGWIMPFGMMIGAIWEIILAVIAIKEFHQLSWGRAIAGIILNFIVLWGILIAIALIYPDVLNVLMNILPMGSN